MKDEVKIQSIAIFCGIVCVFMFVLSIYIKNEEKELSQSENLSVTDVKKNEENAVSNKIERDLFEVIEKNNSSNITEYVVADKKTGLCYLLFETQNGITAIEYKNHEGKPFTIMSYSSYVSPYEQKINVELDKVD